MQFDDRLRSGLRDMADEIEPDLEAGMASVLAARERSPMRRAGTIGAYAAAALLAIVVVGLAGPLLLDRANVGVNPTPGEVPSASGSASAPPCPSPIDRDCGAALTPGNHRSTTFIPPIDYIIPPDSPVAWDKPQDLPGTFTLHPAGPDTDAIFFFRDVRVLTEGCNPHVDEGVGSKASEIVAWLTANAGLVTTTPQAAFVGGLNGVQLDLAASGTYTTVCPQESPESSPVYPAELPIVPLFAGAGSGDLTWYLGGTERMRLYVLDMPGGGNLVISIDAIRGDFDTLLETSLPIITYVSFDPAYY